MAARNSSYRIKENVHCIMGRTRRRPRQQTKTLDITFRRPQNKIRMRSTSFVSSAFFRAFDEVRRMAVLSWLPDRLSYHELAFLCRFAMVISLKHGSAVEVWKLVKVLRQASVARVNETHSPAEVSVSQATVTPAIVICNGDCADKIGELGQAVAALVDGGYCSSLSITACSIGNVGAVALAKACCRETLEELCLESCDIGNAGAAALLVALGEGLSAGLRKLVLSGNRVGGSIIFARALRNVMTRNRECSLEVDLERCSIHTWGCLALAACVLDADGAESEGPLVLNLGNNLIKDYGGKQAGEEERGVLLVQLCMLRGLRDDNNECEAGCRKRNSLPSGLWKVTEIKPAPIPTGLRCSKFTDKFSKDLIRVAKRIVVIPGTSSLGF
eukprot:g8039.t1